jgi:enolase
MPKIVRLAALEILDSRGRPTLEVTCAIHGGIVASAQVPSGASTGTAEALELRDHDPRRYAGLGCRRAVQNVRGEIADALLGIEFADQEALDRALIDLDGTANKGRLGANAVLGVSLAFARAHANHEGLPLYRHFAGIAGLKVTRLPRPTINLFSGGKHAGGQVAIQDVLVVPVLATSMDHALEQTVAVFHAAVDITRRRYGSRALVADEGGLAPPFPSAEAMLETAVEAIEAAGFSPGIDVSLAVDVASSHFYSGGRYHLDSEELTTDEMIGRIQSWVDRIPLISVEDGLAEEAWDAWPKLVERLGEKCLVLGDDFLCTRTERIQRAAALKAASALLLKVNQVGTLTEAVAALRASRSAGWNVTVSARSGETEDHWLADLATGWSGDQIKIGSITRSERLAKYNRLLAIEAEERLELAAVGTPKRSIPGLGEANRG